MTDVYTSIPVISFGSVTLRAVKAGDLEGLLRCYSDEKAVPLFNSDNCHGDDFHYTTPERMRQAMDFWDFSYREKYFVRWTMLVNGEVAGTVEMFRRESGDAHNGSGVLRIDLASDFERGEVLDCVLEIARQHFYTLFGTDNILTKAIPAAGERIRALDRAGFVPLVGKLMDYGDYYTRTVRESERQSV